MMGEPSVGPFEGDPKPLGDDRFFLEWSGLLEIDPLFAEGSELLVIAPFSVEGAELLSVSA
jgi:hypothetical protein